MSCRTVGIFICNEYKFLGGSPDGILENGDIVEFKISCKPVPTSYTDDYSEIYKPYIYQMMMNCYLTGSKRCHFVMYSRSTGKLYTRIIPFDEEFFREKILIPCIEFWNEYVIPILPVI